MSAAPTGLKCSRAGCTFGAVGGVCANGYGDPITERCPELRSVGEVTGVPSDSMNSGVLGQRQIALPLAGALDEHQAYLLTAAATTRVVVISGLAGTGKTTLLTSIYDRLTSGPLSELYFAGCETLHAFEEWCHDARVASDRETPETQRTPHTPPGECRFLHLRLATSEAPGSLGSKSTWTSRDLLFTDLQGEVFERVRDNADVAARMPVFKRADHFVQLIDGKDLRDLEHRHGAVADAKNILRSCLTARVLNRRTRVHLVVTKWDLISSDEDKMVRSFFASTANSVRDLVGDRVASFQSHITSARSSVADPIEKWGAMELVSDWFRNSSQHPDRLPQGASDVTTEFDRFDSRVLPNG